VEPFTNQMFLAPEIGALIGRRSVAGLPQFLHEVMHQWCFDSPVGVCLTLLDMRARRIALFGRRAGDDLVRDVSRHTLAFESMRPLSEGLALFAEHDLVPGDSPIISRPALLAASTFGDPNSGSEAMRAALPPMIAAGRLNTRHARRKADLLAQPLHCADGGYLAGYLSLKQLHRAMLQRETRYLDNDLWAHVVRCSFYDDWDLVHMLLNDDLEVEDLSNLLPQYIRNRLHQTLTQATAERLDEFEQGGVSGRSDVFAHQVGNVSVQLHAHPLLPARHTSSAKAMLAQLVDRLFTFENDPEIDTAVSCDIATYTLRGNAVTLAQITLEGQVNEGTLELSDGTGEPPLYAGDAPKILSSGWRGRVDAHLIYTRTPPALFRVFANEGGWISTQRLSAGEAEPLPTFFDHPLIVPEVRQQLHQVGTDAVTEMLAREGGADLVGALRGAAAANRQAVFVIGALGTPDAQLGSVIQRMWQDGVLGIVDDVDLLVDAAALSLCAAFRRGPELLTRYQWSSETPTASLDAVQRLCAENAGFAPFSVHEGRLIHSLI
jgi:hypothetical protein